MHEETLSYSDPDINLTELFDDLGITEKIIVSEKDKNGKTFKELENNGLTF
jgi:dTDP-4-dehydrorhamnose 3,5-epimerase-like enzyme